MEPIWMGEDRHDSFCAVFQKLNVVCYSTLRILERTLLLIEGLDMAKRWHGNVPLNDEQGLIFFHVVHYVQEHTYLISL